MDWAVFSVSLRKEIRLIIHSFHFVNVHLVGCVIFSPLVWSYEICKLIQFLHLPYNNSVLDHLKLMFSKFCCRWNVRRNKSSDKDIFPPLYTPTAGIPSPQLHICSARRSAHHLSVGTRASRLWNARLKLLQSHCMTSWQWSLFQGEIERVASGTLKIKLHGKIN